MDGFLPVLSRWLHVITACIALGGVFFMRVVVPIGLASISDLEVQRQTFLRLRRVFKMIIHTAILLFLITGTYNALLMWPQYSEIRGMGHALFGMHLLLALIVFGIALYVTAGKEPPSAHKGLMMLNLVLMLLVVLAASMLKRAREQAFLHRDETAMIQTTQPSPQQP